MLVSSLRVASWSNHTEYQLFQHQVVTLKPGNYVSSTHMRDLDG